MSTPLAPLLSIWASQLISWLYIDSLYVANVHIVLDLWFVQKKSSVIKLTRAQFTDFDDAQSVFDHKFVAFSGFTFNQNKAHSKQKG